MVQICVGGLAYEEEYYTVRVAENYANTPTAPEAVLHKLGAPWDLERISIHIRDGRVFTGENALRDYLQALGVEVVFHPSTYVEVLVPCSSSCWKLWHQFEDNSKLADGAPIQLVPQSLEKPDVLPRPIEQMLATYKIQHHKNKAPGLGESTKRTATLIFHDSHRENGHYVEEKWCGQRQHYSTIAHWHLMNPTATEENRAKDLATNGSPWLHIDVQVGDDWILGTDFLAMRE